MCYNLGNVALPVLDFSQAAQRPLFFIELTFSGSSLLTLTLNEKKL